MCCTHNYCGRLVTLVAWSSMEVSGSLKERENSGLAEHRRLGLVKEAGCSGTRRNYSWRSNHVAPRFQVLVAPRKGCGRLITSHFGYKGQACRFARHVCSVFVGVREQDRSGNLLPGVMPQCELLTSCVAVIAGGAGVSIKSGGASPRVDRIDHQRPRKRSTVHVDRLPPALRAQSFFLNAILGLAPQALCCRPLCGLEMRSPLVRFAG